MDKNTRIVGALHGIGGEPLASALSALYGFNLSIIRPDKKIYGLQKAIEGFSPGKGEEITLVDDVFSSGSSFLDAAKIMDEINGVKVKECCVLVKRNENPNFPFPLKHVFTIDDFF